MTTRVAPGRSRSSALNVSIAPTTRSLGASPANRTWRTVSGPASTGASAVASATIRARASSGTAGSSSIVGLAGDAPPGST